MGDRVGQVLEQCRPVSFCGMSEVDRGQLPARVDAAHPIAAGPRPDPLLLQVLGSNPREYSGAVTEHVADAPQQGGAQGSIKQPPAAGPLRRAAMVTHCSFRSALSLAQGNPPSQSLSRSSLRQCQLGPVPIRAQLLMSFAWKSALSQLHDPGRRTHTTPIRIWWSRVDLVGLRSDVGSDAAALHEYRSTSPVNL